MAGHRSGVTAEVMRRLDSAPRGKTLYLADIADGLTGFTEQQVKSAIYHIASRVAAPLRVETVISGRAWRVMDAPEPVPPAQAARQRARRDAAEQEAAGPAIGEVLEILAVTKNGALIVQDERGDTWKATKV